MVEADEGQQVLRKQFDRAREETRQLQLTMDADKKLMHQLVREGLLSHTDKVRHQLAIHIDDMVLTF